MDEHSSGLRAKLRGLYYGKSHSARRFRYGLVAFDVLTILVFVAAASMDSQAWLVPVDFVLGTLMAIEFVARHMAERRPWRHLMSPLALADLVVIGSLFLAAFADTLAFLRILRTLRLLRSYRLVRDLRADSPWFRRYEDVIQRTMNLGVFVFIVTSLVYVTQNDVNPGIKTYIDALYFTITTLTTTGFGDITLVGPGGRMIAVVIMVVGVALFLRLLQAVFRPSKVRFECPDCALQIHDIDAVHCKHCGRVLAIPSGWDEQPS